MRSASFETAGPACWSALSRSVWSWTWNFRPVSSGESTPRAYADLRAQGGHGAPAAERRDGLADILTEGDEEVVVGDPVAAGQDLAEGQFRALRRSCPHDAQ